MATRPFLRAVPAGPDATSPLLEAPCPIDPGVAALGDEVAELREALFAVGDLACRALPHDQVGVHVAIQAAAHQLGVAQRLLAQPA